MKWRYRPNARANAGLEAVLSESRRTEVNIKLLATSANTSSNNNAVLISQLDKRLKLVETGSGDVLKLTAQVQANTQGLKTLNETTIGRNLRKTSTMFTTHSLRNLLKNTLLSVRPTANFAYS